MIIYIEIHVFVWDRDDMVHNQEPLPPPLQSISDPEIPIVAPGRHLMWFWLLRVVERRRGGET